MGRYDIAVRHLDVTKAPVMIELKVSDTYKGMETACDAAAGKSCAEGILIPAGRH